MPPLTLVLRGVSRSDGGMFFSYKRGVAARYDLRLCRKVMILLRKSYELRPARRAGRTPKFFRNSHSIAINGQKNEKNLQFS